MHKVKALESCLSRSCFIYSITLQCWTWKHMIIIKMYKVKKIFNNFPEKLE